MTLPSLWLHQTRHWMVRILPWAMLLGAGACNAEHRELAPATAPASEVAPATEPTALVQPIPAGQPASASAPHRFVYYPPVGQTPAAIYLAGSFNGWSNNATPMERTDDGGFVAEPALPNGVYQYKFIVDGQWTNDPASDKDLEETDGYGGHNSAVLIGPDGRTLPSAKDNEIDPAGIAHHPASDGDCDVVAPTLLRIGLRTQAGDVQQVTALVRDVPAADARGDDTRDAANALNPWRRVPLYKIQTRWGFDRYGAIFTTSAPAVQYIFELTDGSAKYYLASGMLYSVESNAAAKAYDRAMTTTFVTPDWSKHAVWYQIFPERFRNGDPANDPDHTQRWTSNWWSKLPGETGKLYHDVWSRRYGGDLQGVLEELPYLRRLGVTAIYFNPLFQAADLHKYDTSDYRHIDEHFGFKGDIAELKGETEDPATWQWSRSDKLFLHFLEEAHRQGFKVIIDGVFNHVGRKFWAFEDVLKNGKASPYAGWFEITDWGTGGEPGKPGGIQWKAWDGPNGWLPDFKKDPVLGIAHGPREHLFAITKRWLAPDGDPSRGVDGFRLDAANEVPHPFWIEWRKLVKGINPDAYIVGEIWNNATPWLGGDQFDAVMNYPFAIAMQGFFVNQKTALSPTTFNGRLADIAYGYPYQSSLAMQNLLDSHDTDRFASSIVNPDLPYDGANRIQDNGPNYNPRKPTSVEWQRMRQALVVQMTWVGAPMIYYGDEAGMWSPDDPSNRQPMVWKDLEPYDDPQVSFNQEQFNAYQRLIAIRHRLNAPLATGMYRPLVMDDSRGLFAFSREIGDETVIVAINRSDRAQKMVIPVASNVTGPLINWLDPHTTALDAAGQAINARPSLQAVNGTRRHAVLRGTCTITLPAWGSAVLSQSPVPNAAKP